MKITTIDAEILTTDAAPLIELFKDLGFEIRHHTEGMSDKNANGTVLRDPNGFKMNILELAELPLPAIRMNIDDFDEAVDLLTQHGFAAAPTASVSVTETNKSLLMKSPSGMLINVIKHIK